MLDDETQTYESSRKRKRNLGRSARRRRKKALEVEAAAQEASQDCDDSATGATTATTPSRQILPTDRHYILPTIAASRTLAERDEQHLMNQLGYLPGNALAVAAKASDIDWFPQKDASVPIVLRLYPVARRNENEGKGGRQKARKRQLQESENKNANGDSAEYSQLLEPFPTIYWVTHPLAKALISQLELDNFGRELEERLQTDTVAMEKMARAHVAYGEERHDSICAEDWTWIRQRKWESAFAATRGVAGIRNFKSIKCLHAHTAHYWSGCTDNIVGQWVSEHLRDFTTKKKPVVQQQSEFNTNKIIAHDI